ncbi:hypothetical protein BKA69DRAFT_356314 [Paraphysoderma sedebokerense]|nr:hypothetical protein BKA69DRAFT_356314 [Paraphysoderma sedebokerense]
MLHCSRFRAQTSHHSQINFENVLAHSIQDLNGSLCTILLYSRISHSHNVLAFCLFIIFSVFFSFFDSSFSMLARAFSICLNFFFWFFGCFFFTLDVCTIVPHDAATEVISTQ